MKKLIFALVLVITSVFITEAFSQLPNQNTRLLRNLNQHFTSTLYSAIWGYQAPNGREYAILGCPTGTSFVDITDTSDIHEVDYITGMNSSWREMKTFSHYAYVVSEAEGSKLQIMDLQYLPDSVKLVKVWGFTGYTRTHSISQSGHYLYLNGGNASTNGGVCVVDITDPENPVKLGSWTTRYVHDCRVIDDTIYAANISDERVSIINATNKNSLTSVTSFVNLPGSGPHNTALTTNKKRLFVTDEIGTAPHLLKVWNIENLSNITYVTNWQPTGITTSIVHNIEIYGNYGIIAHYSAGVRIIDISNPDAPTEVAWYDTYPSNNAESYNGCWGVYMFPSQKIIASDRQTGLYVLRASISLTGTGNNSSAIVPGKFSLEQNYPNPFNPSTSIRYSLIKSELITLKIFDILGNEVSTLVNERQDAGVYNVNFNAVNLPSGNYFYRINAGDYQETKLMTLIK